MNRLLIVWLVFIASVATVSAQTERDLKQHFEGKTVTLQIDMPAAKDGVNVFPERGLAMDYDQYAEQLKRHGAAGHKGDEIVITKIKVQDNSIEVKLGNELQASTGFIVHFKRLDSFLLT